MMLRYALQTVRDRKAGFLGTFLALLCAEREALVRARLELGRAHPLYARRGTRTPRR
ncbi:hypothetical protein [Streptomyces sp. NBC_01264]|uniref:hypothetical protein n=1 Tax=Streptomyces sp. NBC_01264 TaxID=2903804 RepID=UPI0022576692|nr:hypothetical protein [Streptomyces sp. NBC_01264]MCX4781444.1 hypothetical protein [Streptomyces sp. NBC_01264]